MTTAKQPCTSCVCKVCCCYNVVAVNRSIARRQHDPIDSIGRYRFIDSGCGCVSSAYAYSASIPIHRNHVYNVGIRRGKFCRLLR